MVSDNKRDVKIKVNKAYSVIINGCKLVSKLIRMINKAKQGQLGDEQRTNQSGEFRINDGLYWLVRLKNGGNDKRSPVINQTQEMFNIHDKRGQRN